MMSTACSKRSTIGRRKSFPSVLVSMAERGRRSKKSAGNWAFRASGSVNWRMSPSRNYAARSAKRRIQSGFRSQLKKASITRISDSDFAANITIRLKNIMNRIIEANFFLPAFDAIKERPRILIIDNNRDFTYSAKLTLERTGRYAVWEENEPARAHQTAQRVQPDLILLDIAMPETDGGEVAARIESDPTLHRTPVVFLTALVTKAEVRSDLQIQGHPFLAKPISIPELVAGIERYLPAHAPSIRDTNKPRILIVDDNLRFSQS